MNLLLSAPGESPSSHSYVALVDTGADFTLIPLPWLLTIDASEVRSAYVRGLWSKQQLATLYLVDLHLANRVLPGIEVIGVDIDGLAENDEEIVLGRNVLNNLYLFLEGPGAQTHILERRLLRF